MPLKAGRKPNKRIAQGKRSDTLRIIVLSLVRPEWAKALIINAFALAIIFADEKKEEKNSFILYTFVKFALVTEQKLNIEEYSISSVNPVPFQA